VVPAAALLAGRGDDEGGWRWCGGWVRLFASASVKKHGRWKIKNKLDDVAFFEAKYSFILLDITHPSRASEIGLKLIK
jgi:hypothetical protein